METINNYKRYIRSQEEICLELAAAFDRIPKTYMESTSRPTGEPKINKNYKKNINGDTKVVIKIMGTPLRNL